MVKIDIFSGFLGAGKTTLIKKLIKEAYDLYPDNDDECKVHLYLYKESILQRLQVNEKLNLQIGGTKSDD